MCGIAGIYDLSSKLLEDDTLSEKMRLRLKHRGPDGSGCIRDQNMSFVHTRLSVLDLSDAAHQPMWDEKKQNCITYNGEIYNFKDIRKGLESKGIVFKSTGDTEVLLKACIIYGVTETLKMLNGMFAFAFWNKHKKELWLARDRMGIKPLYFTQYQSKFIFSSEIKAILAITGTPNVDLMTLYNFLSGGTTYEPYTVFSNIKALNPGHYIHINNNNINEQCAYYTPFDDIDEQEYYHYDSMKLEQMVSHYAKLMDKSVRTHSVSDAPVAVMASGGLDSSLISALAKRNFNNISLYHAEIVGEESETKFAKQLSNFLNLPLIVIPMEKKEYIDNIAESTFYHETPSAYHPNDIPFQLVAKEASNNGIKVFLTGEGADELFLGYEGMSRRIIEKKLYLMFKMDHPLVKRIISKTTGSLFMRKNTLVKDLSSRGGNADLFNKSSAAYSFIHNDVERDALISGVVYLKSHLGSLLQRNDRMGMMHGLESRIPFLENGVIRFALNLPLKYKQNTSLYKFAFKHPLTRNKYIVRKITKGLVPDSIVNRKKMGFPVSPEKYLSFKADFFTDGFLESALRFTHKEFAVFFLNLDIETKWNFFATEIFGKLFFQNNSHEEITERIKD